MSTREQPAEEAAAAPPQAGASAASAPDVESLTRERDEYLARWQRAAADYQNLKRRSASEVEGAVRRSLEGLLSGLLLVVDHLELALKSPAGSEDAQALARGVGLTLDQLLYVLRQQGVEPILAEEEFDPALHEAVATLESDELPAGRIVDTLRRGYTWRGQMLRFAHVRVARAPQSPPAAAEEDKS